MKYHGDETMSEQEIRLCLYVLYTHSQKVVLWNILSAPVFDCDPPHLESAVQFSTYGVYEVSDVRDLGLGNFQIRNAQLYLEKRECT